MQNLSILAIIAGNAFTYEVAVSRGGSLSLLLWTFLVQSLAVGTFAFLRIHALQRFSTHGVTVSGKPVEATAATKQLIARYFAMHYGIFHAVYVMFLLILGEEGKLGQAATSSDVPWIAALGATFFIGHGLAHRQNVQADIRFEHNIGALMFLPYARVLPMHVVILFCATMLESSAILLFIVLKTAADIVMHVVEHHWSQRDSVRSDRMHFGIDED